MKSTAEWDTNEDVVEISYAKLLKCAACVAIFAGGVGVFLGVLIGRAL